MLKKFLKDVVSIIAGKPAEDIVDLLDTKKYVNEFIISKKLNLTINQTRNILYKVSDQGLVSSIRKKDKKKGWYTYFWKIEPLKSLEFLKTDLVRKINATESQINSRETKRFYVCEGCHIEMAEENALLCNFTCNECGSVFTLKDNAKTLKEMKKVVERLKGDLVLVDEEIVKESGRLDVIRVKIIKKEEKVKKAINDQKKIERAKLRALKKKSEGKDVKKSKKVIKSKKKVVKKIAKKVAKKSSHAKKRS